MAVASKPLTKLQLMKPRALRLLSLGFGIVLAPALQPSAFGQATLTHRYSFNDTLGNPTFVDSVGGANWTGTNIGSAVLDGSQLQLDGGSGRDISLPLPLSRNSDDRDAADHSVTRARARWRASPWPARSSRRPRRFWPPRASSNGPTEWTAERGRRGGRSRRC